MTGLIIGIAIVIIIFIIAYYKVEKDEKREALWEEKFNEKFGPKIEQFKNNIETYKSMMYRNDIVKMHGKEYIITGVDYHPTTYQYAGDCTYESFAYWTISLKLIDEDPKMQKEITIDIDEFTKNNEDTDENNNITEFDGYYILPEHGKKMNKKYTKYINKKD